MRYFNREQRVPDWRTFNLRVLLNFHLTLTISHGTRTAVRQRVVVLPLEFRARNHTRSTVTLVCREMGNVQTGSIIT